MGEGGAYALSEHTPATAEASKRVARVLRRQARAMLVQADKLDPPPPPLDINTVSGQQVSIQYSPPMWPPPGKDYDNAGDRENMIKRYPQ